VGENGVVVRQKIGWPAKKLAAQIFVQYDRSIEFSVQKGVSENWRA
jgi:hypothetical protein